MNIYEAINSLVEYGVKENIVTEKQEANWKNEKDNS